jgi:hypothetical protein
MGELRRLFAVRSKESFSGGDGLIFAVDRETRAVPPRCWVVRPPCSGSAMASASARTATAGLVHASIRHVANRVAPDWLLEDGHDVAPRPATATPAGRWGRATSAQPRSTPTSSGCAVRSSGSARRRRRFACWPLARALAAGFDFLAHFLAHRQDGWCLRPSPSDRRRRGWRRAYRLRSRAWSAAARRRFARAALSAMRSWRGSRRTWVRGGRLGCWPWCGLGPYRPRLGPATPARHHSLK